MGLLEYSVVRLLVFINLVRSLSYAVWFTVLSLVNYWQMEREDIVSDIQKYQSSVRTQKLLVMAVINIPLAVLGVWDKLTDVLPYELATPTSLADNIASLQMVLVKTRSYLDTVPDNQAANTMVQAILAPSFAFYIFAWFGFGAEARKAYGEALLKLGRLVGVTFREFWPRVSTPPFSWSAIVLWKSNVQRGLANALHFVQPSTPQITP